MPNRILRQNILESARVAQLSWADEVFYRRLMSIVDDYGRTEASPLLLRSKCYPLQTDQVRAADISRSMAACQKAGLIVCYDVDGKQYLELLRFGQQQRTPSKCPPPPEFASNCEQVIANAHLDVDVFVDVNVRANDELFERFWQAYPRHTAKQNARKAWDKLKLVPDDPRLQAIENGLLRAKQSRDWLKDSGQFIPHAATWLNGARWNDDYSVGVVVPLERKVAL